MTKGQLTLEEKWKVEENEPIHIRSKDGSEKLVYPDGSIKWIKKPKKKGK